MAKDVKFNIKLSIDGKEHIVEATTDVKHFAQELGIAETKGKRLRDSLLKFNGLVTLFQGLQSSIQQVTGGGCCVSEKSFKTKIHRKNILNLLMEFQDK